MREFWRRIEHGTVKPWLRRIKPWRTKTLGGVRVQESMAGAALAVALAIASGAASGGLLTGRRDAWPAFAVATSR